MIFVDLGFRFVFFPFFMKLGIGGRGGGCVQCLNQSAVVKPCLQPRLLRATTLVLKTNKIMPFLV